MYLNMYDYPQYVDDFFLSFFFVSVCRFLRKNPLGETMVVIANEMTQYAAGHCPSYRGATDCSGLEPQVQVRPSFTVYRARWNNRVEWLVPTV